MAKAATKTKSASKNTTRKTTRKKPGRKPGTAYKKGLDKSTVFAPKLRLAVRLFEEKMMSNQPFTVTEVLRAANYSESSIAQYSNIMDPIRQHLEPIVERLQKHREKIMDRMEKTVAKADYASLVRALDVTTKNIQLLTGRSTDNFNVNLTFRKQVEHLMFDKN